MKNQRIKIAIQRKGRLSKPSKKFLASLGLNFPIDSKRLTLKCKNELVNIVNVRDDDIPRYVSSGAVDFGIVGLDVLEESKKKVRIVKKLGFCKCKMVVAAPKIYSIKTIKDLQGKKVATSYPNILRSFLEENKIQSKIVIVAGSVELAPYLKTADAVCDITQTGRTLKEFNLIPIKTILKSEAVLISPILQKTNQTKFIEKFLTKTI